MTDTVHDPPPWLAEVALAVPGSVDPAESAGAFLRALVEIGPAVGVSLWHHGGGPPALLARLGIAPGSASAPPLTPIWDAATLTWPLAGAEILRLTLPMPPTAATAWALERVLRGFGTHRVTAAGYASARGAGQALAAVEAERQATLEALRESQSFLTEIVENLPDMIFVKDAADLRFVRFNRAGERLLGFPSEALLGKNDYNFFPREEADFFTSKDREVLASGRLLDIPCEEIQTRLQGIRSLHTKKIPILDATGSPRFLLGISEDITEARAAREALARTSEELRRSNEELRHFATTVSHDLQEPLRAVAGFADLLRGRISASLDDEGREWLDYVVDGARRMQRLVRDLLAYARLGVSGPERGAVDLEALLAAVLEALVLRMAETGAVVTHDPLPVIAADEVQMGQLLQNLIGNALDHGGGQPPRVHVGARQDGDRWVFVVRDEGIGFEQRFADRLFEPFYRLDPGVGSARLGSGIGLAVCKRIVESHGGLIEATGAPGEGATFRFWLPIGSPEI